MNNTLIAVTSVLPGGLDAPISQHFGHAEVFTLVEVDGADVLAVSTLSNVSHAHGGCMAPVRHLFDRGVEMVITGGIGEPPLLALEQVGIRVYIGTEASVSDAIAAITRGDLRPFTASRARRGGKQRCQ